MFGFGEGCMTGHCTTIKTLTMNKSSTVPEVASHMINPFQETPWKVVSCYNAIKYLFYIKAILSTSQWLIIKGISELIGTWIDGYISVQMTELSREASIRNAILFLLDFNICTKPNNCSLFTAQKLPVKRLETFLFYGMIQEFVASYVALTFFFWLRDWFSE